MYFKGRKLLKEEKPKYIHDCDECVYLGTLEETYVVERVKEVVKDWEEPESEVSEETEYIDLYAHWNNNQKTLIGRYGDEGSYYFSGIEQINSWSKNSERLEIALQLAIDKGIIPFYVAYPIELRNKWLRPPEKLSEIGPIFSDTLRPFIYQNNTKDLEYQMKASLHQVWYRMRGIEWVEGDMPDFEFISDYIDSSVVNFRWKDRRVAATSRNDYITEDPCPELPPEPSIFDVSVGYLGKYRKDGK